MRKSKKDCPGSGSASLPLRINTRRIKLVVCPKCATRLIATLVDGKYLVPLHRKPDRTKWPDRGDVRYGKGVTGGPKEMEDKADGK